MFFLALVISLTFYQTEQKCEQKYRDITENHSMCLTKNENCLFCFDYDVKRSSLVGYHNKYRNDFRKKKFFGEKFPPATNMLIMEWDEELYQMAGNYAMQCIDKPDCDLCHQTEIRDVSQNFAVKTFTKEQMNKTNGPTNRFRITIMEWMKELILYRNPEKMIEKFQPQTGLYTNWTNILRANTYKVGCSLKCYETPNGDLREIYICNYSPAILEENQQIYEPGTKSCSHCPNNYVCDKRYQNLCGISPREAIVPSTTEKIITIIEKPTIITSTTEKTITTTTEIPTTITTTIQESTITPTISWTPTISIPATTFTQKPATINIEKSTNEHNPTTTINTKEQFITLVSSSESTPLTNTDTNSTSIAPILTNSTLKTAVVENNSSDNILWRCDFEFPDDDCLAEEQCYKDWNIIISENKLIWYIILPKNKISGLLFLKTVHVQNESCFMFNYRTSFGNIQPLITISGIVIMLSDIHNVKIKIERIEKFYWTELTVDIPWTNIDIKVGIAIRSDSDVESQYIEISQPTVYKGRCTK